jgi:hypothetical protein
MANLIDSLKFKLRHLRSKDWGEKVRIMNTVERELYGGLNTEWNSFLGHLRENYPDEWRGFFDKTSKSYVEDKESTLSILKEGMALSSDETKRRFFIEKGLI